MKMFYKKAIAFMLAVTVSFSVFGLTGCGPKDDGSPETLSIFAVKLGYGTKWLEEIIEDFKNDSRIKEKYPNLKVDPLDTLPSGNAALDRMLSGKNGNKYDLLFSTFSASGYLGRKDQMGKNYEDLTDLFNTPIPGETNEDGDPLLMKDKLVPTIRSWCERHDAKNADGSDDLEKTNYSVFPWVNGTIGLMYNKSVLDTLFPDDYRLPKTTDELDELAHRIIDKNTIPYIYTPGLYDVGVESVWHAQYSKLEGYNKYFNLLDADDMRTPEIIKDMGKTRMYQTLNQIVGSEKTDTAEADDEIRAKNHSHNTLDSFDQIQIRFLAGQGVFMFNGDWFATEMDNAPAEYDDDIRFMKTPIISAVSEQLSYYNDDKSADSGFFGLSAEKRAGYDAILRKLVMYADGECDKTEVQAEYAAQGKSDAGIDGDIEYIEEIRTYMCQLGGHEAFIPSYADAKDLAKEFLLYMATDKAIETFMRSTYGCSSAFSYDVQTKNPELYDSFNIMQKERHVMVNNSKVLPQESSFKSVAMGGFGMKKPGNSLIGFFTSENAKDRATPREIIDFDYNYYTKEGELNWKTMLQSMGL